MRTALCLFLTLGLAGANAETREFQTVRNKTELTQTVVEAVAQGLTSFVIPVRNEGRWFTIQAADEAMREIDFRAEGACPWYGASRYTETRSGPKSLVAFSLEYRLPQDAMAKEVAAAESAATLLAAEAVKVGPDPLARLLYIHDALVARARYDKRLKTNGLAPVESYTPYGSLVAGVSVCDGFSKAFLLVADKLGLECRIVKGQGEGVDHSWNLVRVGETWYHVDATFDLLDPPFDSSRAYFMVDDTIMARNHSWDRSRYPACPDDRGDYYSTTGACVENFDEAFAWLGEKVTREPGRYAFRVRSFDPSTFTADAGDLARRALWGRSWAISAEWASGLIVVLVKK